MNEHKEKAIRQMADRIKLEWEQAGQPMRPAGTRDGDNDRCEMEDEIWARINENFSTANEDEISEVLTKWHKEQPTE